MNNYSLTNFNRTTLLFSTVLFLLSLTANAQVEVESSQQEATGKRRTETFEMG